MHRLVTLMLAGSVALAMSGSSWAADQPTTQQEAQNPSKQNPPTHPLGDPLSEKTDKPALEEQKDEAYSAELKRCEAMSDATQKKKCVDKVQKDRGNM